MKFNEEGEAICELIADSEAKHSLTFLTRHVKFHFWKKSSSVLIRCWMKEKCA